MQTTLRPVPRKLSFTPAVFFWVIATAAMAAKDTGWVLAGVSAGAALAGGGALWALQRTHRRLKLEYRNGEVLYSSFGTERKVVAVQGQGGVLRVTVSNSKNPAWQLWFRGDGTCAVSLIEATWNAAELDDLRRRVGLPVQTNEQPMTMKQLAHAYPGSLPDIARIIPA